MKYLKDDAVKTTEIMDKLIDMELMGRYYGWARESRHATGSGECRHLFYKLYSEARSAQMRMLIITHSLDLM